MEHSMRRVLALGIAAVLLAAVGTRQPAAQESSGGDGTGAMGRYLAPATQVVAIRAGRLFDARSGTLLTGQTILIRGERIAEVGPNVRIPREARVIDLSGATVLPGMIDAHVHLNTGGNAGGGTAAERAYIALASAQTDLLAGFTTVADMDSRGGFNTVDLRDAINAGLVLGTTHASGGSVAQHPREQCLPRFGFRPLLLRVHGGQERELAVARPRGRARGEAARRRLGQDLHDTGFRRPDASVHAGRQR